MALETLTHLLDAPLPNLLVFAGLVFLGIAVIGRISGTIDPGAAGRVTAGALGVALVVYGLHAHTAADAVSRTLDEGRVSNTRHHAAPANRGTRPSRVLVPPA